MIRKVSSISNSELHDFEPKLSNQSGHTELLSFLWNIMCVDKTNRRDISIKNCIRKHIMIT